MTVHERKELKRNWSVAVRREYTLKFKHAVNPWEKTAEVNDLEVMDSRRRRILRALGTLPPDDDLALIAVDPQAWLADRE